MIAMIFALIAKKLTKKRVNKKVDFTDFYLREIVQID